MFKKSLIILFTIVVAACGGGGGSSAPATDPNTIFTLFDMNVVRAGTNQSFNLSGSDTTGLTYTGSLSIVDKGLTTFMMQPVRQTDFTVSLIVSNGASGTTTGSVYGDTLTRAVLFSEDDTGVICTASTSPAIPDTAKPGDSGSLSSLSCSDGSTESGSWRLEALVNELAKIIYSVTFLDQFGNSDGIEENSFTIDTSGNVISAIFKFHDPSGVVVTLNGS